MTIESYLNNTYTMKFYGNETNTGAHFPLNVCLLHLRHRSAKKYVEIITEWISNLPSGAWSSWLVSKNKI